MPKNGQTTTQLHSSHTSKVMFKFFQARQYMNQEFQMFKLDLEKAEEPQIKFTCLLRSLYARQEAKKLEPDMEQWTGS